MGEFDVAGMGGLVVIRELLLDGMDGGIVGGMGLGVDGAVVAVVSGKCVAET